MKAKFVLFISVIILSTNVYSQKIETFFSSGYSLMYTNYDVNEILSKTNISIVIAPRINLALQKEMSVSLDIQPSIFFDPIDWFDNYLMRFYIPANVNFNFGYASTKDSEKNFGFYAGIGPSRMAEIYFFDEADYNYDYKGFNFRFGLRYNGRKNTNREIAFFYSSKYTLKHPDKYNPDVDIPVWGISYTSIGDFFHGN